MDLPKLDFLSKEDNYFPSTDHLKDIASIPTKKEGLKSHTGLKKYESEYESFCRWSSLPDKKRVPKTLAAFESKFKLPKTYTRFFKERSDFKDKVYRYFWDWVMELWPNIVYEQYEKAVDRHSDPAAKFFSELVSKHMEENKPKSIIQPFLMVGVPQDKINKLFEPVGMEKVEDIIPEK